MNARSSTGTFVQKGFLKYFNLTLALILVLTSSACGRRIAQEYLIEALDQIEASSIKRGEVDWESLRRDALAMAADAQITRDTYPAIRFAIDQLGDRHSSFQEPQEGNQYDLGFVTSLGLLPVISVGPCCMWHPAARQKRAACNPAICWSW